MSTYLLARVLGLKTAKKMQPLGAAWWSWRRGPESNRPTRICNPVHNRFATAPCSDKKGKLELPFLMEDAGSLPIFGAGNEARTRDLNLGKVALYQLSYSRI